MGVPKKHEARLVSVPNVNLDLYGSYAFPGLSLQGEWEGQCS